jgi:hypothetical protein
MHISNHIKHHRKLSHMHKTRLQPNEFLTGVHQLLDTNKECLAFSSAQYTTKINCKPVNRCHDMNPTVFRHNLTVNVADQSRALGCLVHVGGIDFALHTRDQTRTAALPAFSAVRNWMLRTKIKRPMCGIKILLQGRHCTCNAILRRFRLSTFAVE